MNAPDQDRFFSGGLDASIPVEVVPEGVATRLINGRFFNGFITNGIEFEEFEVAFSEGTSKRIFTSNTTFQEILSRGDVQLVAPLETAGKKYLIFIASGLIFLIDARTEIAYEVTPRDSFLPDSSAKSQLSYLDNSGEVPGLGGYQIVYNYPNLPIFLNEQGARLSNPKKGEMPVARLGASVADRIFIISGDNILLASDILGSDPNAPLTFFETFNPSTGFTDQNFIIGNVLGKQYVTGMQRLFKFGGPSDEFLARNLVISTRNQKHLVAATAPRENWEQIQFITALGTLDGFSGPLSSTTIGDNIAYVSTSGRTKLMSQDQARETSLSETYFDSQVGQYLNKNESNFYFRDWYKELNHSRSMMRFLNDRLYTSVYPFKAPAVGKFGEKLQTVTHRALSVASLDESTKIGPQASFAWEGFYDYMNPVGMVTLGKTLYVVSKEPSGRIRFFKSNFSSISSEPTTVYTRGYFSLNNVRGSENIKGVSLMKGDIYFQSINGHVEIEVCQLVNNEWKLASQGVAKEKLYRFILENKYKSDDRSVPLKITIQAKPGARFELKSTRVDGEAYPGN